MSFFNKIFGSSDKKPAPTQVQAKTQVPEKVDKNIKIEAATVKLDVQIKNFEDNEKKLENKINLLKAKAKQYIQNDKKKDARKYVEEASRVQKQLEAYSLRRKALQNKKYSLQQAQTDILTIDVMQQADANMKDKSKYAQKLQQLILNDHEAKMQQEQINDKLRDLVQNDDQSQDVDQMLNQLMGDIQKDKKAKIKQESNKIQVKVPKNKVKQQKDQIQDMLMNL